MDNDFRKVLLSFWCALLIAALVPAFAQESAEHQGVAEATESVEEQVEASTDDELAERRMEILQEAVDALAQTNEALTALEDGRTEDALEALALTTGKLELIVARKPDLALAPTGVTVTRHDIYGSPEAIENAIERASDALDEGRVQTARRILDGLASEYVMTVTNLPLSSYPDAIKAITPLIDAGKIEEAKSGLRAALGTVVLVDHVIPLPVLRTGALLERAEELAENPERTEEENTELENHLAAVRTQLEMAELLGYGEDSDFEPLHAQLDEIVARTKDGKSGEGFFDRFRAYFSSL